MNSSNKDEIILNGYDPIINELKRIEQMSDSDNPYQTISIMKSIAGNIIKLLSQAPAPNLSLTDKANGERDRQVEKYSFQVPYNGTNDFYNEKKAKAFTDGWDACLSFIQSLNLSAEQVASDAWEAALDWFHQEEYGGVPNKHPNKSTYLSSLKGGEEVKSQDK